MASSESVGGTGDEEISASLQEWDFTCISSGWEELFANLQKNTPASYHVFASQGRSQIDFYYRDGLLQVTSDGVSIKVWKGHFILKGAVDILRRFETSIDVEKYSDLEQNVLAFIKGKVNIVKQMVRQQATTQGINRPAA